MPPFFGSGGTAACGASSMRRHLQLCKAHPTLCCIFYIQFSGLSWGCWFYLSVYCSVVAPSSLACWCPMQYECFTILHHYHVHSWHQLQRKRKKLYWIVAVPLSPALPPRESQLGCSFRCVCVQHIVIWGGSLQLSIAQAQCQACFVWW